MYKAECVHRLLNNKLPLTAKHTVYFVLIAEATEHVLQQDSLFGTVQLTFVFYFRMDWIKTCSHFTHLL